MKIVLRTVFFAASAAAMAWLSWHDHATPWWVRLGAAAGTGSALFILISEVRATKPNGK